MLELILGRAGTGKTTLLRKRLAESTAPKTILIVPEQYTFESERALLMEYGAETANRVQVYSFTRLAQAAFLQYGGGAGKRLTDGGRRILMTLALENCADQLTLFKKSADRMTDVLLNTVGEMKICGIEPDMLHQLNDSNYQFTIGHLMDISILVRSNSTVVGSLSALPEPVKFSIAVPEQMQNSGRVFKVLRLHDNHISVIDSEYSNGIVAFETDEFSTYALVYGDMKAENQMNTDSNHAQNSGSNEMQHNVQTGDNTYLSITLLSVLLAFSLTLVIVLVSKKKHKKDE